MRASILLNLAVFKFSLVEDGVVIFDNCRVKTVLLMPLGDIRLSNAYNTGENFVETVRKIRTSFGGRKAPSRTAIVNLINNLDILVRLGTEHVLGQPDQSMTLLLVSPLQDVHNNWTFYKSACTEFYTSGVIPCQLETVPTRLYPNLSKFKARFYKTRDGFKPNFSLMASLVAQPTMHTQFFEPLFNQP
ncbi:hypothetical protein FQA39_LY06695 [Lamprigera yunnana]|nr:hypothetical protein FQA39_LY06695 [Lamprigera yunnana]